MKNLDRRNKYFFGLGTIGRDMCSPSCASPTR